VSNPWYTFTCEILSRSLYPVVLLRRKPPVFAFFANFCRFLPFFGLWHLVMSPIGIDLRKLSTGAQLQTFPYPTASKSFVSVLQRLRGEIGRTNSDVEKRDGQTDNQTFWPPRRRVKLKPHQTWHGDRGPRARSCTSKTFGV